MKSYLVLSVGLVVAAAACGGSTGDGGLTSTGSDAGDGTGTDADGGTGTDTDGGTVDNTNYNTPTKCTSGTNWTRGDRGSASMHPGVACIDCHTQMNGPDFSVAGTVYPSAHEPDDCNGVGGTAAAITVVIVDKNNQTYKIPVNAVGNFYSQQNIVPPYAAKVVSGTKERAMVQHQTSGDCNSCHTVNGAQSAPGRIMAP